MGGSWGHPIFALSGKVLGKINRRLHIVSSQQFSSLSQFLSRNYIKATSTDSHIDLEFASRFFLLALVSRWEYCKYFFFWGNEREREIRCQNIGQLYILFPLYHYSNHGLQKSPEGEYRTDQRCWLPLQPHCWFSHISLVGCFISKRR